MNKGANERTDGGDDDYSDDDDNKDDDDVFVVGWDCLRKGKLSTEIHGDDDVDEDLDG